jgi:cell division cycle 2-like protein
MAELILREPLICGKSEIDQLERMFKIVGTPNEDNWPGWRELKFAKKYS